MEKPKIVVFSNRAINQKFFRTNFLKLSTLNDVKNTYETIFITPRSSSDKVKQELYLESGHLFDKVISYHDEWKKSFDESYCYATWRDFLEKKNLFEEITNVKHLVIAGGLIYTNSGLSRSANKLDGILETANFMKFRSLSPFLAGYIQMINIMMNNPDCIMHELICDPLENVLSNTRHVESNRVFSYHYYDSPSYNFHRHDGFQYWLNKHKKKALFRSEKTLDLTFGFAVSTELRLTAYEKFTKARSSLDSLRTQIYIDNKYTGEKSFLDRNLYLEKVEKSKFTFVIPAYDTNHFSATRFIESVELNTLPLVASDTSYHEFIDSYGISPEIFESIIVDYEDIAHRIQKITESERLNIISYLKNKLLVYEKGFNGV